jgi:TonB family protein
MSRRFSLKICFLVFAVLSSRICAETDADLALKYVSHKVRPEYPYSARVQRLEGKGIYQLDIDPKSGAVVNVSVVKSTGYAILDRAVVRAFQKWRFVPGALRSAKIPVTFSVSRGFRGLEKQRANALYCPIPPYPPNAPMGAGRFEVIVDFETGLVRDVRVIQTTGDGRLDRSVTKTFRTWRFRPRTTHSFTTPFNFL